MFETTSSSELAIRFINQTNRSIFLTGKAGTGKTTLLKRIITTTHKKSVIVAPTGIAALNAGGVTIHSFFQLPFSGFIPEFGVTPRFNDRVKWETKDTLVKHFRIPAKRKALFQSMELLVIDEVSMLRADLLDAIDWTLRTIRKRNEPFGGVQVLFIGDLLQLPPVVKNEEWAELKNYYSGIFFFHAKVVKENPPLFIELTKIYRQDDERFIHLLNHLRNNQIDATDIEVLNAYVHPNFDVKNNPGFITLTTHNAKADAINLQSLHELKGSSRKYTAEITGEFPGHMYPLEEVLELKIGAQVMFVKNDLSFEKNYYNGKMGEIKEISSQEILVYFPEEKKTIEVEKYEWQNIRYTLDDGTKEIKEEVLGTFVHYPLKLAWAITVHKSQGLTFEKAILDVSQVFAPGQAYVALSRLRSLNGLVLLSPMQMNGLSNDQQVMSYTASKPEEAVLEKFLEEDTFHFVYTFLVKSFEWRDVDSKWRIHEASYLLLGSKSEKGKHKAWAAHQASVFHSMVEPAQKFISQLNKLFATQPISLSFISERVQAANSYFFKTLENCAINTAKKMEEVKRIKKIKAYYEELEELETEQFEILTSLLRAGNMLEMLLKGEEITKDKIWKPEILHYRKNILDQLKLEQLQTPSSFLDAVFEEEEEKVSVKKTGKSKDTKEPKKTTYEVTLELIRENKSLSEIAANRIMSEGTIVAHFVKLIKMGEIQLNEVISSERISALADLFDGYTELSLTPLKEKVGDTFTWDELKLFRASLEVGE
jgi:hypothetical protein